MASLALLKDVNDTLTATRSDVDAGYRLSNGLIVFYIQAGFLALEAGFVRKKSVQNIVLKNIVDAALGALCFFFLGFGFAYGGDNPFIGGEFFALAGFTNLSFFMFQWSFSVTAATIVSGSMCVSSLPAFFSSCLSASRFCSSLSLTFSRSRSLIISLSLAFVQGGADAGGCLRGARRRNEHVDLSTCGSLDVVRQGLAERPRRARLRGRVRGAHCGRRCWFGTVLLARSLFSSFLAFSSPLSSSLFAFLLALVPLARSLARFPHTLEISLSASPQGWHVDARPSNWEIYPSRTHPRVGSVFRFGYRNRRDHSRGICGRIVRLFK
jgi:Ammonium Transporter Family